MYTVKLNLVPETGLFEENGLMLGLEELGLSGPFLEPGVRLKLQMRRVGNKVMGEFDAQGRLRLSCSRCLTDFEAPVSARFMVEFEPRPEEGPSRSAADPEDPELAVAFFDHDLLPVGEELRQELELKVPIAPLCREACRGLCPHCGKDLNHGDCAGASGTRNLPFAGLSDLMRGPDTDPSKGN